VEKKQASSVLSFALLFLAIVAVAKLAAAASEFWAGLLLKMAIVALVVDALALIVLVMFQDSKSGGLTGLMGAGGAMDTVIGPRTGEHINKITTFFAVVFFSLVVATGFLMKGAVEKSVVGEGAAVPISQEAPSGSEAPPSGETSSSPAGTPAAPAADSDSSPGDGAAP